MLNKREIVLIISLAFCAGAMFSDFTKPKFIEAKTSNIVYDTLDAKINALTATVTSVTARVTKLESTANEKDPRLTTLSTAIKQLSAVQKDLSTSLDRVARDVLALKRTQLQQQQQQQ